VDFRKLQKELECHKSCSYGPHLLIVYIEVKGEEEMKGENKI